MRRCLEQGASRLRVVRLLDDAGQPPRDQRRSGERLPVGVGVPPLDVERLCGVSQRVERSADRLGFREAHRQRRLVDDAHELRPSATALHAPVPVADAEVRRPFRARVRRRDRDERESGLDRDRLAEIDGAASPERDDPVRPLGCSGCRGHPVGGHLGPDACDLDRQFLRRPALARHEQRSLDVRIDE
jgi:hypothetical protein